MRQLASARPAVVKAATEVHAGESVAATDDATRDNGDEETAVGPKTRHNKQLKNWLRRVKQNGVKKAHAVVKAQQ